jgi:hypothetical protein
VLFLACSSSSSNPYFKTMQILILVAVLAALILVRLWAAGAGYSQPADRYGHYGRRAAPARCAAAAGRLVEISETGTTTILPLGGAAGRG